MKQSFGPMGVWPHWPNGSRLLLASRTAPSAPGASLRLINANWPALDIATVEFFDRGICALLCRHFDKAEAARAVRRPVHYDLGTIDWPGLRKDILQILISDSPGEIPNVQSAAHYLSPWDLGCPPQLNIWSAPMQGTL